jgi:hypothetical protein
MRKVFNMEKTRPCVPGYFFLHSYDLFAETHWVSASSIYGVKPYVRGFKAYKSRGKGRYPS